MVLHRRPVRHVTQGRAVTHKSCQSCSDGVSRADGPSASHACVTIFQTPWSFTNSIISTLRFLVSPFSVISHPAAATATLPNTRILAPSSFRERYGAWSRLRRSCAQRTRRRSDFSLVARRRRAWRRVQNPRRRRPSSPGVPARQFRLATCPGDQRADGFDVVILVGIHAHSCVLRLPERPAAGNSKSLTLARERRKWPHSFCPL